MKAHEFVLHASSTVHLVDRPSFLRFWFTKFENWTSRLLLLLCSRVRTLANLVYIQEIATCMNVDDRNIPRCEVSILVCTSVKVFCASLDNRISFSYVFAVSRDDRGRRRRASFLASIWLTFAHGRAPSALMESRKTATLPSSPVLAAVEERPTEAAGAGAPARAPWAEETPRSRGNSRDSGSSSSGSAAGPASSHATKGIFFLKGEGNFASTAGCAPLDTAAPAHSGRTPAGRHAAAAGGLTGGALFPRNRDRKQQQGKLQASSPTSSNNTGAPSKINQESAVSPWPEVRRVLKRCLARAGSGGLPGAAAGLMQVATLMWLRTIVNYQCRYGTSTRAAAIELYRQGGVLRFYRGVVFALVSNPLSRFGMAAANEGAMAVTDALPRQVNGRR